MNYYKFHVGDYRRDTAHLSLVEHGIYRQLIDQYYLSETPLPEIQKLMRSLSIRNAEDERSLANVLSDFFELTDDGYIHKRCDLEIDAFHQKSTKAKESANERWERVKRERDANAMRTHSEGNANHKPLTNKPLTNTPLPPKGDEDFVSFWKQYPKKDGKGYAIKAWEKAKKNKTLPHIQAVLLAIEREKQSTKWLKDNGQFIPNPATWINGQGWENGAGQGESENDDKYKRFIAKHQPAGLRKGDEPARAGIPGQLAGSDT